jgi:hypothetical protein
MKIVEFIQHQILIPRLQQTGVLVVYDPDRRYRELCLALAGDERQVVDAGESSIESRAAALAALQLLSAKQAPLKELLVYVPHRAPLDDDERQRDPFALYAVCGSLFPDGDGDEYFSICIKAKPDYTTEIRRIFHENPDPAFAVIDAVGGGAGWPNLQAALGVESAREILFALLAPEDRQKQALQGQESWQTEAKALFHSTLGLTLLTRAKTYGPIADELWRFLLFSEFVFDLPVEAPATLANIPRAQPEARPLVEDLCDLLRNNRRTQALYIARAEAIEAQLDLPDSCRQIADLGVRDTFPFEERSFFAQAVDALKRDNVDQLRRLLDRHTQSIWVGRGENQAQWQILQTAAGLIEACSDAERQLPDATRTQEAIIDLYLTALRDVDRRQREFEQAVNAYVDPGGQLTDIVGLARSAYQKLTNRVQNIFVRHLEKSGWPPAGRLSNADVFDRVMTPRLQESGRRVALLLINALRYELGVELQKQLAEEGQVELQVSFAPLPSVTSVSMVGLLPGAGQSLRVIRKDDGMAAALDDQTLTTVAQRMDVLQRRYGQRFAEIALAEFVQPKATVPGSVELLVIRSNEMDSDFERNPDAAPSQINRTFRQIIGAVSKLREIGFQDAIIVTDHGFYLNTAAAAGDVCAKPAGHWVNAHDRMLLGDGTGDAGSVTIPAESLGIRGEFNQVALPRAMVAYRAGLTYFHGGASLHETVTPVIAVRLSSAEQQDVTRQPTITLSYKRASKRITTRLPVMVIEVGPGDLFWRDKSFEILLEAQDKKGGVVGETRPGGAVNAATRTVTLTPDSVIQVTLKMDDEFQGKFSVKALDPTTLKTYAALDLETDYTV